MLTPKPNVLNCFMHNSVQLRASFLLQFINYCGFVGKSLPSTRKWYFPTKRQSPFTRTHGFINQKTRIWIFNVVKSPVSLSKFCALRWKMGILSIEKFAGEFNYCHLLKRTQLTFTAWVVHKYSRWRSGKHNMSKTWFSITAWRSFF